MKKILSIALNELRQLFYSPIAWFVLVIFAVQCGVTFTYAFDTIWGRQITHAVNWDISRAIFSGSRDPMLLSIKKYLFLYIPLITMGIMNKERTQGTASLLLSSPVSSAQIVLGKYLALMVFGLALMAVLMISFVFCCFTVDHFCEPAVLTAFLGVYLLICAYCAIGLFMSCLISYPVASGLCTIVLFIILKQVGGFWQDVDGVNMVTYWLSVDNHTDNLMIGLFSSEDFFYYILVSALFIGWTILYVWQSRRSMTKIKKVIPYFVVTIAVVMVGILTSMPKFKFFHDYSYNNANTIKPEHQDIMRHLTKGLTITTYSNLFDDKSLTPSDVKDFETTLEPYIRFKPDIRLKYIWYYDDGRNHPDEEAYRKEALKTAMMKDVDFDKYLSPKEIREMIDLSSEEYKFVQILSYDGMTARLRNYDDPASRPMEGDYIAAFKRLGMRLPVIGMLSGHGERSIMRSMNGDYSFIMNGLRNRQSFQNLGFDVREVSLTQSSQQLDSCDLLVVADPRKPLSDWELAQLNNYVRKGGNMMVLAERESMPILTPLLDTLGISMSDSYLLQENKGELPDLVLCNPAQTSIKINKYFKWYLNSNIAMQGASTLKWKPTSGFTYIPLTVTLPSTWLSTNLPQVNDDGTYVCSGKQGKFVTAVGLTRNISGHKQQRILVTGDADWISNGELNRQRAYIQTSQFDFIKPLVQWFSYGELPVDVSRNIPPDTMLHFSQGLVRPMHWFFWCIVPLLFAITGNIIIVKRKRK